MTRRNSANQIYSNNADGWTQGGGDTPRSLTLTGGNVTFTGSAAASSILTAIPSVMTGQIVAVTATLPTAGSIPFASTSGILTQDNTNLYFDNTTKQIISGTPGVFASDAQFPFVMTRTVNDFVALAVQNLSTGDTATSDLSVSADNDTSTLVGHYVDMGITGSGWSAANTGAVRTVSIAAAGTGYSVSNVLTLVGGSSDCTVTVATIGGGGSVTSVTLTDNGTNYVVASALATTGGGGTGCTINVLTLIDYTLWAANDAYMYVSGGNLSIGTDGNVAGKVVKFHAGGYGATNETGRIGPTGLTVGLSSTVGGKVLLPGLTSGTVTVQVASVAGTWGLTLPTSGGSSGQVLRTDGNGITTWVTSAQTRVTSIISVSSTIAAATSTDYTIFANVGITTTLPTAVSNTNRYTIKNISASSVLIATTSAQTIDGSSTALLPVTNISVDLVSNNSNWQVV